MGIPLGKKAREAVGHVKEAADKASAFLKLALALSVAALALSALALLKAVRIA